MATLISKPGINSSTAGGNAVPAAWSQSWFRGFISDYLKGADVRNAVGANGIVVSGNITSPYATISIGGTGPVIFGGPVTFTDGVTITGPGTVIKTALFIETALGVETFVVTNNLAGGTVEGYGPTVGGLVDMTPDTGTFTFTLTGCTTSPTATGIWARIGNMVTLILPAITGTSNTTSCTLTGLPAKITPAHQQLFSLPGMESGGAIITTEDSGVELNASSSTLVLFVNNNSAGFGNTLTKGLDVPCTITYILN